MQAPITGTSGLTTKSRLASGSPAVPAHTPAGLAGLSFKKTKLPASAKADPVPGPSAATTKLHHPPRPTIVTSGHRPSPHAVAVNIGQFVESPQSIGSFGDDFAMNQDPLAEADQFLANIMPPA